MQEMPVQSAIITPQDGSVLDGKLQTLRVAGYAWSGGGRSIARVDVSIDGGRFWHSATLKPSPAIEHQKPGFVWAWTHWECDIPIPPELRNQVQVICKAVDSNYTSQPEGIDAIWNMRGLNNNAWHRIHVWLPREKILPPKPNEAPPPLTVKEYQTSKK
jgi:sulfite oxidase